MHLKMSLGSMFLATTPYPIFSGRDIYVVRKSHISPSSYVCCVVIIGSHMIDQDWDGQVGIISHVPV